MIAALLSLLLPGCGQFYKRQPFAGIVHLLGAVCAYAFFIYLGGVVHLGSVIHAALVDPAKNRQGIAAVGLACVMLATACGLLWAALGRMG